MILKLCVDIYRQYIKLSLSCPKESSYGAFELLQSHLLEKTINYLGLILSAILKARKTLTGNSLLYKDK